MDLHIIAIMFILFKHINEIFTQGLPTSPCPKMFQYRFDGSEWFGMLSVRNPSFGQPLHLRVILSMRGKPATNYLGDVELLTRGQFFSDAPVLYKIKFPKSNFPPKLMQITTNNQVICLGEAEHGIFVTQIQLEHTRKFTVITDEVPPPIQTSPFSSLSPATAAMDLEGSHSVSMSSLEMNELSMRPTNVAFGTKHLPLTGMEKNPMRQLKGICGTIDERIRFQVLHKLKQKTAAAAATVSPSSYFENQTNNGYLLLLSTLLSRQSDVVSAGGRDNKNDANVGKVKEVETKRRDNDDEVILPPLITTEPDLNSESINNLPSITRGAWPWLAAIYVNNLTSLTYQCGGTLVSTRIVVTAAHCFQLFKQRYTPNEVLVFLGRHNLKNWNEDGSLAAPVDDIFIHPDYNQQLSSYDADISVVVLRNEVRFNIFIRPACMWSGSTKKQYIEGEHGIVVGWGLGGLNNTKYTSIATAVPKIVSTPIVANDVCFKADIKYHSLSSNRTFCAGNILQEHTTKTVRGGYDGKPLNFHHQLHQGPCAGDSGSGLMIFKNNRWILRGIVVGTLPMQSSAKDASTSTQSCITNQYVIYTDVAEFLDWIFAFMI